MKRTTVASTRNCALKLWDISGQAMQGRMLDKYIFGELCLGFIYCQVDLFLYIVLTQGRTP